MYSEAESWVRSNALLTFDQQSTILVELDQVQKSSQASASVKPGTPKQPTERPLWNTNGDAQKAPAAAQSQTLESSSAHHTRLQAPEHGSGAALRSDATTSGSAAVQALSEAIADSKAGTSTSGIEQGPGQFGWYGNLSSSLSNWWQQVIEHSKPCSLSCRIFWHKRTFTTPVWGILTGYVDVAGGGLCRVVITPSSCSGSGRCCGAICGHGREKSLAHRLAQGGRGFAGWRV